MIASTSFFLGFFLGVYRRGERIFRRENMGSQQASVGGNRGGFLHRHIWALGVASCVMYIPVY